jgi:menaquinone-specific isochorismate synthase
MLNEALALLGLNTLSKVVLKRKKVLNFTNTINSIDVFKTTSQNVKDSYKIFAQNSSTQSFISFSPEKLFSLDSNSLIDTISLAGSAPRGLTPTDELKLENELINSEKLIHEQQIVTDEINKRLNTIATDIKTSELSIMKLQYIQHRANHITAILNPDKNILDIITTLHPTPAVGGAPNEMALSTITNLEQDSRKNYAAPIGFATSEYSEWAVGLRSASVDQKTITIYAGCGIVNGSDPKDEWLETENKMRPFVNLFTEVTTNG